MMSHFLLSLFHRGDFENVKAMENRNIRGRACAGLFSLFNDCHQEIVTSTDD